MHVCGLTVDLNGFLQFIFTVFVIALGLLHLVKNTASKYFVVDANFESGGGSTDRNQSVPETVSMETEDFSCANCGNHGTKKCSRCKSVRYCSVKCQEAHWKSEHKTKCKYFIRVNSEQNGKTDFGFKASVVGRRSSSGIALVPACGTTKPIKKPQKVLFPYDEFIKLYHWDKASFLPCGLLNCGNSCFANVVLQCLTFTRPLVAYLLEKDHQRECRRNDWCFLCEFQAHVERASKSTQPFSPMSILSRLPNIGGNLGYGRQEDAHEFMRFAIDTMQSVCLDEFGGEKVVDLTSQETTLIQHIFGGHLQSQVICTKCDKISNQLENMMDLTVEIHGDAASLEECLDQFTVKEWLHGENMYRCDGCNDYVKAWKRLTIRKAPNILTVAFKRFQSGRFGKLNKRVSFPETLDLSPYTSGGGDGTDLYKLYAVVVHVDMLNASFFGHYICYIKDFHGNWYRVDDCKVRNVDLEEVLSQGAYMLLYNRVSARSSCLREPEPVEQQQSAEVESGSCMNEKIKCMNGKVECMNRKAVVFSTFESTNTLNPSGSQPYKRSSEIINECDVASSSAVPMDISYRAEETQDRDNSYSVMEVSISDIDSGSLYVMESESDSCVPIEVCGSENKSFLGTDSKIIAVEDSGDPNSESGSAILKDIKVNGTIDPFQARQGTAGSTKPNKLKHSGLDDER